MLGQLPAQYMGEFPSGSNDADNGWTNKKSFKLKDIFSRQTQDSENEFHDYPDLDFEYADTDTLLNEMSELYSYTEQPEYQANVRAFEDYMDWFQEKPCWKPLDDKKKNAFIMALLDQMDASDKNVRLKCARCFLYLLQGCWAECQSDIEQHANTKENVFLLYRRGVFHAFLDALVAESDAHLPAVERKVSVNLNDSMELRVIISVMYVFVEEIRVADEEPELRAEMRQELAHNEELLAVRLFEMVTRFCGGGAPHFPIKKILLFLWKVMLLTLGGSEEMRRAKAEKRVEWGLGRFDEDTVEIVRMMRASSPPPGVVDGHEAQMMKRENRQLRRSLVKQSSLDESLNIDYEGVPLDEEDFEEGAGSSTETESESESANGSDQVGTSVSSSVPPPPVQSKGLPWVPKIRQQDLDAFLDHVRMKFVGYVLPNDRETLIGLPQPIQEGIKVLKRYVYVSLSDVQIEREENISKYPFSQKEVHIPATPPELLYQAMLPNMQQHIIALLKILLAAAPTSKTKTDSINIMADVLPEEMPMTVLQSMKLSTDVIRHKEIIVKAVSAILLLLLKHLKLNHIYQFEFVSQYLVFANCIPLILKFFNQNISTYVGARNGIPMLDFPTCVLGEQPELTSECLDLGDSETCCWRNVFSCINLLRVLNKVTKWKHSRIMMLVVFKSAPILRRTLKARHAMMQLYILKLLKIQTKYLGRQWRKSNMKTMSAIYQKVRHRLNDDWAYGNDIDARPWDFQVEECNLRTAVDKFNNRRYVSQNENSEYSPVDVDLISVLAKDVELTDEFKKHYYLWLQQEVFEKTINWDELLNVDYYY